MFCMALSIHPLNLGTAETDTSFAVWGRTPGRRITLAITGYLILGGDTPIVVDTGGPFGHLEKGDRIFDRTEDQSLAATLAPHGVGPDDVGLLVLTHLHSDHTGELSALPSARIALQRRELEYAEDPFFPASMYPRAVVEQLCGPLAERVEVFDGDRELVDGVRAAWTGGHSPGHQQIEVQLDSGLAIITGGNAYLVDPSITEQVPPGYVTSIPETMRALADIARRAVHPLPMHDPSVHLRYPDGVR
jgi:glyoxylase-like metal-dependent hydrolase (beta-lactamase superfamily II)